MQDHPVFQSAKMRILCSRAESLFHAAPVFVMMKIVPAQVAGDNEQIAFQIPVFVRIYIFNEAKKDFLRDIIGIRFLSREIKAETIDFVVVSVGDHTKRLAASVMNFFDQFFVGHFVFPVLSGVCFLSDT